MAPMTRPLMVRGAEAANMCSPVLGSEPIHTWVLPSLRALAISGVPGERKAVKSELEKRIKPMASINSTSSCSPAASLTTERAYW